MYFVPVVPTSRHPVLNRANHHRSSENHLHTPFTQHSNLRGHQLSPSLTYQLNRQQRPDSINHQYTTPWSSCSPTMQCLLRRARVTPLAPCCSSSLPSYISSTASATTVARRPFTSLPSVLQKSMPSRPKPPPDSEIEESYLKGSGPGGQKINKTNSAVQLKHIPTGIVVKSQATRSRAQNRKHAREILAQRLDDLYNGDQSRASIVGAVRKKKSDSAAKKSKRKYKKLEEEKAAAAAAEQAEQDARLEEPEQTDASLDYTETTRQTDKTDQTLAGDAATAAETTSAAKKSDVETSHIESNKPTGAVGRP
ncbi:hypothetical protein NLG97_g6566 [Lecanicillium saksenae]|uniref:Uncharacterized protein n=1 Tax=Lecanicillium saksenae TaxID=468837 RepID=A0ACC1QPA9_9HYPO|nr:hypothetical protein NLG97_g6566 [Lecanicillium saksenae]